jgi:hypothetical protein
MGFHAADDAGGKKRKSKAHLHFFALPENRRRRNLGAFTQ